MREVSRGDRDGSMIQVFSTQGRAPIARCHLAALARSFMANPRAPGGGFGAGPTVLPKINWPLSHRSSARTSFHSFHPFPSSDHPSRSRSLPNQPLSR